MAPFTWGPWSDSRWRVGSGKLASDSRPSLGLSLKAPPARRPGTLPCCLCSFHVLPFVFSGGAGQVGNSGNSQFTNKETVHQKARPLCPRSQAGIQMRSACGQSGSRTLEIRITWRLGLGSLGDLEGKKRFPSGSLESFDWKVLCVAL